MSRGDESFPRYTYMMDFNPDEDTPLKDYWHTADDLDNEDAATIASLATQALQSKSYGYGDGQVSESLAANYLYSESRSSPQSQYSTTMQPEPAESFRGLMEDHDRGARLAEVNAISDYDFEHEARGHASDEVAGMEEPSALSREQHGQEEERYAHDPFRPLLSEPAAEVETAADENLSHTYRVEMSAAMTASRVVNGVLRRSYASTPIEMDVDPQPLQSQAPQPTSPQSESSPVSVPTPEVVEPEQEVTIADDEQHVDDEPETAPIMEEEKGNDEGEEEGLEHGNEDLREEVDERRDDGEQEAVLRVEEIEIDQAEEVRAQEARKLEEVGVEDDDTQTREDQGQEETQEAQRDETWEAQREEEARSEAGVQQQLIEESNERPTINDSEDLPPPPQQAPRKRGRPRKSDVAPAPPDFRAEQLQAAEVAVHEEASSVREVTETAATDSADLSRAEELPTERKRGRPRKSEGSAPAPAPRPRSASAKRRPGRPPKTTIETTLEATQTTTVSTGKRGRPRKSSMAGVTQPLSVEASTAAPPASGKRGRPQKSEVMETSVQASTTEVEVSETGEVGAGVSVPGKRGRPRKSEAISTDGAQLPIVEPAAASAARAPSRRGRPRKSETTDDAHASTSEAQPSTVEAAAVESTPPTAPSGKRGRPRKSEAMSVDDARVLAVEEATVDVGSATPAARSSSKRGRPRKRDASSTHEAHLPEFETTTVGTAAPAARSSSRRGRPRKSDTLGDAQASAVGSQPHPVETAAVGAATPTARSSSRRGRPRKSGTLAVAQASTDEFQLSADETTVEATTPAARSSSKRGRPRKRHTLDFTQVSTGEGQLLADELTVGATLPAARSLSRRGRPRKSDATSENTQASTNESQLPVVDAATSAARSSSRRGRPRKSDATDTTHLSINEAQLPVAGTAVGKIADTTAPTPGKRGRPRKSSFVGANTQAFTAEPHLPAVAAPDIATPASNKRGRPRKIDGVGDTQAQLSTAEASTTTTPALGKRGRPRSASVASSTTTPGRRGRPPKNTVPLLPAEIEALSSDEPTTTAVSTFSIPLGQPIRAFLQADEAEVAEEEAAPPSPLSVKKRGRGRPPKSPALLPVNVPSSAPAADHVRDIWEFDPQSPINRNAMRSLTADKRASRPTQETTEGTPVRKQGRRKSVVADQPLPATDVSFTSPTKKRGRPPKATAAIHLAETDGPSGAVEGLQEEEGPMTKRIRTDNDTTMEDAVDEDDPQRQTLEDGVASVPSVSERTETPAPSHTIHQQSASTSMKPRISGSTEESSAVSDFSKSFSRPDGRPRIAEESTTTTEMLDKGTQTRAVEKPSVEPPRSIFELLAGARRTNKVQKTYGKRFKRL